jgi:murein L,D-transpeptidase YcbB/YkuD
MIFDILVEYMENFKFILFSIFIVILVALGGYWGFSTIESGSSHVDIQKQKELESKNEELGKQVSELQRQISILQSEKDALVQKEQEAPVVDTQEPPVATPTDTKPTTTVYKYQSLINDLQKLVDGNIFLKLKSQGPAVGTLQKFLNIYTNTSNKIDNDYGVTTVTRIKSFQKAQGLTADGEAGPNTYKKMISWLKTKK